jgi:hypothetical protein
MLTEHRLIFASQQGILYSPHTNLEHINRCVTVVQQILQLPAVWKRLSSGGFTDSTAHRQPHNMGLLMAAGRKPCCAAPLVRPQQWGPWAPIFHLAGLDIVPMVPLVVSVRRLWLECIQSACLGACGQFVGSRVDDG